MKRYNQQLILWLSGWVFLYSISQASGQEVVLPLSYNIKLAKATEQSQYAQARPTNNNLPFFEDFTSYEPYPSPLKWADKLVYINNTMSRDQISRGIATFDALNEKGQPYDSTNMFAQRQADSLTSLPFNLTNYQVSDNLMLSFFYQAGGLGFMPKASDSLMLFFKRNTGEWRKVWSVGGAEIISTGFEQAYLMLEDEEWLHDDFQFRFINKATKGLGNSHWHLDYIRFDANRNLATLAVTDIAFISTPISILKDYASMPFWHFKPQAQQFLKSESIVNIANRGAESPNLTIGCEVYATTGQQLYFGTVQHSFKPNEVAEVNFPMYTTDGFNPTMYRAKHEFEHLFFTSSHYPDESLDNDTLFVKQVFNNYFAYDDGSAERSYYLNMNDNNPGKIAVEFALTMPDTIRGAAIRFAREIPAAYHKEFSIAIFKSIEIDGEEDELIYQEDFLQPRYEDSDHLFSIYAFSNPVPMPQGVFYLSIIQPAGGVSDSLLIALDMNRVGANYRYYNVENEWLPSQKDGALLFRPIVGADLSVSNKHYDSFFTKTHVAQFEIAPNPALSVLHLRFYNSLFHPTSYRIIDMQGRAIRQDILVNQEISIDELPTGIYVLQLEDKKGKLSSKTFIKK